MQDLTERSVYREDHEQFREQARRFFEREIVPHHAEWERQGIVPKEVWRKAGRDRKSTRLNSSHSQISYAVFCLKKKNRNQIDHLFLLHVQRLRRIITGFRATCSSPL